MMVHDQCTSLCRQILFSVENAGKNGGATRETPPCSQWGEPMHRQNFNLLIFNGNSLGLAFWEKFVIVLVEILVFHNIEGKVMFLLKLFHHLAVLFL
jgi:hypothetical protein